jgi:hypothetical protein
MGIFDKLFGGNKKSTPGNLTAGNVSASDALMDEDRFWRIIHTVKLKSHGDYALFQEDLADELGRLAPQDIILFGNRFRYFRGIANTWELWGAIYIIHGGCNDDSFNDFREWVIGQGKEFFYKTIKDPDSLVEVATEEIEDIDWEGLGYVPSAVYKEKTGQDMPYPFREQLDTTGREWDEDGDDLRLMFPRLSAKYPDNV